MTPRGLAANECSGPRVYKVHVTMSANVDSIVAVGVIVISTEVTEIES